MPKPKSSKANLLLDTKSILGEGPIWDWRKQLLFWVDIEGKKLHQYNPTNERHTERSAEEMIGAIAPTEASRLLLAMESDLASFDFETGQLIWHDTLQNTNPEIRCNDGKVAPNGDFWIGTMHKEVRTGAGALYRVSPDYQCSRILPNTTISNGMAWNSDNSTYYFIDTPTLELWRFDYNAATGEISNKSLAFSIPESFGSPDGMCIDSEDMVWIAHWGGNCVRRWNPKTGEVLEKVEVDAPQVTCCCFGGQHLNTLYITTARDGMSEKQMKDFPASGGLFVYTPEVKGTQITYFKDK